MALIVEDGTIVANANSYISAADAGIYHAERGNEAWVDLEGKEALLIKATDYMVQAYRLRWSGTRVSQAQGLDWPRAWVPITDLPEGYGPNVSYLETNVVPKEIKNACAELALMASSAPLAPNLTRSKSAVSVGEISVTYDPTSAEYTRFRSVDMMLSMYLTGSPNMMKLVRS